MQTAFTKAFNKLAILGHNAANLIDCSDVIPAAPPLPANAGPHLPAGQKMANIEQGVSIVDDRWRFANGNIFDSVLRLRSRLSRLSQDLRPLSLRCKSFPVENNNSYCSPSPQ
jgi:hypothetical protein